MTETSGFGPGMPPPPSGYHAQHAFPAAPQRDVSVQKLTVPAIMVLGFCSFLVVATYAATSQFSDIKYSIEKLSSRVENLTTGLEQRVQRLENQDAARWTARDHETWCARAELANQGLGWTCARDGETVRRTGPTVNGWSTSDKP